MIYLCREIVEHCLMQLCEIGCETKKCGCRSRSLFSINLCPDRHGESNKQPLPTIEYGNETVGQIIFHEWKVLKQAIRI